MGSLSISNVVGLPKKKKDFSRMKAKVEIKQISPEEAIKLANSVVRKGRFRELIGEILARLNRGGSGVFSIELKPEEGSGMVSPKDAKSLAVAVNQHLKKTNSGLVCRYIDYQQSLVVLKKNLVTPLPSEV